MQIYKVCNNRKNISNWLRYSVLLLSIFGVLNVRNQMKRVSRISENANFNRKVSRALMQALDKLLISLGQLCFPSPLLEHPLAKSWICTWNVPVLTLCSTFSYHKLLDVWSPVNCIEKHSGYLRWGGFQIRNSTRPLLSMPETTHPSLCPRSFHSNKNSFLPWSAKTQSWPQKISPVTITSFIFPESQPIFVIFCSFSFNVSNNSVSFKSAIFWKFLTETFQRTSLFLTIFVL